MGETEQRAESAPMDKLLTLLTRLQESFIVMVGEERADCVLDERSLSTSSTSNDGDIDEL